jgi:hypothetical protein
MHVLTQIEGKFNILSFGITSQVQANKEHCRKNDKKPQHQSTSIMYFLHFVAMKVVTTKSNNGNNFLQSYPKTTTFYISMCNIY